VGVPFRLMLGAYDRRDNFHVYQHSGHPEDGIVGDEVLRSERGFASMEEANEATRKLLPAKILVMLRGRYSGVIVGIRRPGQQHWTFLDPP
jgi:hypothetical protein